MMHIRIDELSVDIGWQSDADAAALAVRNPAPATRSDVINDRQRVWKNLKEKLKALSHDKCWYCESIDARADNAVDHYRPKGNVKDSAPPHDGYWWLAFDWHNYRFSCGFCNSIRTSPTTSGGKQDYFPLLDENRRARSDQDDIDAEQPLLLDPTNPLHIGLIAFADDGSVGPASDSTISKLDNEMAEVSIKRYHLDHPTLVERRAILLRKVRKWVNEADRHLARSIKKGDPVERKTAAERLQDIMAAISEKAEYSAAAKHLLAGMERSDAARIVLKNR